MTPHDGLEAAALRWAIHEAGHALRGHTLGRSFELLRVYEVGQGSFARFGSHGESVQVLAQTAMAGPAAEMRFLEENGIDYELDPRRLLLKAHRMAWNLNGKKVRFCDLKIDHFFQDRTLDDDDDHFADFCRSWVDNNWHQINSLASFVLTQSSAHGCYEIKQTQFQRWLDQEI